MRKFIEKIIAWFNYGGRGLHAIMGAMIWSISFCISLMVVPDVGVAVIVSIIVPLLAMLGKELYDSRKGGTGFDWTDILAGMLIPVISGILMTIIYITY